MSKNDLLPKLAAAASAASLFWPDFVERHGNIYLALFAPRLRAKGQARAHDGLDNTGREAFHNHVHLFDMFGHSRDVWDPKRNRYRRSHPDFRTADRLGRTFAQTWFAKLRRDFPDEHFRVYYSSHDNPIVRFHRVYPDEPVWSDDTAIAGAGGDIIYDSRLSNREDR
jgi:hypothetical protein